MPHTKLKFKKNRKSADAGHRDDERGDDDDERRRKKKKRTKAEKTRRKNKKEKKKKGKSKYDADDTDSSSSSSSELESTAKPLDPLYDYGFDDPRLPNSPASQAYKEEREWQEHMFESLWDDAETSQDFWQAEFSIPSRWRSRKSNNTTAGPSMTYDQWVASIRKGMAKKQQEQSSYSYWGKAKGGKMEEKHDEQHRRRRKRAGPELEEVGDGGDRKRRGREDPVTKLRTAREHYTQKWQKLKDLSSVPQSNSSPVTQQKQPSHEQMMLRLGDLPLPIEMDLDPSAFRDSEIDQFLNKEAVNKFLFSNISIPETGTSTGSESVDAKKVKLKEQLLLWHPDKFMRHKRIFLPNHWDSVLSLVNCISQILNSLNEDLK
ncbi:hypothetical protein HK102_011255 [Quaeritorhiza haematococci]|nr:hypothetical protein HK102_011255 [Quaeritorhiza haematococci]